MTDNVMLPKAELSWPSRKPAPSRMPYATALMLTTALTPPPPARLDGMTNTTNEASKYAAPDDRMRILYEHARFVWLEYIGPMGGVI